MACGVPRLRLVVSLVVLSYVFMGGSRGAAFANTFQTIVFMIMGLVAFTFIINAGELIVEMCRSN